MRSRGTGSEQLRITVRFFAAAKAAFGAGEHGLALPEGGTIADALELAASAAHGPSAADAARVFARSSFIVDGRATRDSSEPLRSGALLDVLPPFAGG